MNQYSETLGAAIAPAKPKTRKAQATRARQLAAAEALFAEKGYFETSIADITQKADVALGTFYVYFPSKLAVFQELVRHLNHRLREDLRAAIEGLTRRADIERAGFQAFFAFVDRHRNLYSIVQQAELVDPALYRWYYRSLAASYAKGMARAIESGDVKPLDPECLAWCLMGMAHFLGMRWVLWEGQPLPERQFESALEFIHRGILKP
ncbi:MAG: TetR/AcrR family transcriptional regulator [Acidobacteriota bacterium]|nr:TetR/AcrR family transcriptional regulator [Acidobacteriota bacterium]